MEEAEKEEEEKSVDTLEQRASPVSEDTQPHSSIGTFILELVRGTTRLVG